MSDSKKLKWMGLVIGFMGVIFLVISGAAPSLVTGILLIAWSLSVEINNRILEEKEGND